MTERTGGDLFDPPAHNPLVEPAIGSVIQFRVQHGQRLYDYAAIRAGDGRWYATGSETVQAVGWTVMIEAVRPIIVGSLWVLRRGTEYTL